MTNSIFDNNYISDSFQAPLNLINNNFFDANNLTFSNNYCKKCSGLSLFIHKSNFSIHNSSFFNNSAQEGSCFYINNCQSLKDKYIIESCTFTNNKAFASGGAILLNNSYLMLNNSIITNNFAYIGGGIRYINRQP